MEYTPIKYLECGPGGCLANFETVYEGCSCLGSCTANNGCSCLLYGQDTFINRNSIKDVDTTLPILECSSECACSSLSQICKNRCVQLGVSLPLEVFNAGEKGQGLRCVTHITKGRFVIEYVGEVIGPDEVERRQSSVNYVLTVKEVFQNYIELTYIDPSTRGNQARFINHSCNPNLVMILVRYGTPQVHVGLFALRDIPAYEELTYDYGISKLSYEFRIKNCLCSSDNCRLFLPASGTATG